jgi:16S rRNA (cytidine1402-2'-O)-methyltransferase
LAHPLVIFEAPHRLVATLSLMQAELGERRAAVARELTKVHEEFRRATLAELIALYSSQAPRGECVIIVAGAPPAPMPEMDVVRMALRAALARGLSPSQAAREVAHQTGVARQSLYAIATEESAAVAPSRPGSVHPRAPR